MRFRLTPLVAVALLLGSIAPVHAVQVQTTGVQTTTSSSTTTNTQQQGQMPGGGQGGGPGGGQQGGPGGGNSLREACHNDDEKVCPGVLAAHGNIVECLKAHIASVSQACRTALQNMKEPPKGGQGGGQGGPGGGQPPSGGPGGASNSTSSSQ
jgi:hypothetical protein